MSSKVVKQGDSYAIHHLSEDGSVRAVRPTDRAVYRLWKVLQDQVDELHAKLKLADSEARKFRATTLELSAQNRIIRDMAGSWVATLPERVIGAIGGADFLAGPTPEAEQQRVVITVLNELVADYLKNYGTNAEDSAKEVAKSPRNAPQI